MDWYNQTKRDFDINQIQVKDDKENDCQFIIQYRGYLNDVIGKEQGIEKKQNQLQI